MLRTRKSDVPFQNRLAQQAIYLGLGVWWCASGAYYLWGDRWDDWLTGAVLVTAVAFGIVSLIVGVRSRRKLRQAPGVVSVSA